MKLTERRMNLLLEFMNKADAEGCLSVVDWGENPDNYLPPFVCKVARKNYEIKHKEGRLSRYVYYSAYDFFQEHPYRRVVLVANVPKMLKELAKASLGHDLDESSWGCDFSK